MKLFNNKDKLRILLGMLVGLLIYYTISVIVKLIGFDIFRLVDSLPILTEFNNIVMSNILLEDLVRSILFTIETTIVIGTCSRIYTNKRMIIIALIIFPLVYIYNLLMYYFNTPGIIMNLLVPLMIIIIYSIMNTENTLPIRINVNERIKSVLTGIIYYIGIIFLIGVTQRILIFLKFNILGFAYVQTNIFNLILFNLDSWLIYVFIYTFCKILNKGDEENVR